MTGGSMLSTGAKAALGFVAVFLMLLLAAVSGIAAIQRVQLGDARERVQALEGDLEQARERADRLEARLEEPDTSGPPEGREEPEGDGPLDDLFGGDNPLDDLFGEGGDFGDALDELLEGGMDELGDAGALLQCAQPAPADAPAVPDTGLDEQVDVVAQWVEELRGLRYREVPDPTLLTSEELAERAAELIEDEYPPEQARTEAGILTLLGAIPADLDLQQVQEELFTTQVAGFYDPDDGELVVRADGEAEGLDAAGQVTLAHELDHALTDQAIGLPVDITDSMQDGDGALAALSVVEGDATLLMQHFAVSALDPREQLSLATDPEAREAQAELAAFPHVIQRSLVFPYEQGLRFACASYAEQGWEGVDGLYDDLPTTTAQILWPQRYAAGEEATDPRDLSAPDGYDQAHASTFGAAELLWLLEAPGDRTAAGLSAPEERAAAWAGGEEFLWTDGDRSAGGLALVEREGERDLCATMQDWYRAAFPQEDEAQARDGEALAMTGEGHAGVITCDGGQVRVGIGPGLPTAREVVG